MENKQAVVLGACHHANADPVFRCFIHHVERDHLVRGVLLHLGAQPAFHGIETASRYLSHRHSPCIGRRYPLDGTTRRGLDSFDQLAWIELAALTKGFRPFRAPDAPAWAYNSLRLDNEFAAKGTAQMAWSNSRPMFAVV